MPLSSKGLCDAEITTPAVKSELPVRYATPGVGITPALMTSPARPRAMRQLALDPFAGFTRIAANQEARMAFRESPDERGAETTHGQVIERICARLAADAVCAEESRCHRHLWDGHTHAGWLRRECRVIGRWIEANRQHVLSVRQARNVHEGRDRLADNCRTRLPGPLTVTEPWRGDAARVFPVRSRERSPGHRSPAARQALAGFRP